MIPSEIKKLYYSISELAQRFNVSESTLRNWEKEFSSLKPKRSASGERKYTEKDIKAIEKIINLRKDLTLSGAKKVIDKKREKEGENEQIINKLKEIRSFLTSIKDSL